MIVEKDGFKITAVIHGMHVTEAKKALERLISSADKSIIEISVIHGYSEDKLLRTWYE